VLLSIIIKLKGAFFMPGKIEKAVEIFKTNYPDFKWWYAPYVSEANGNCVDIFTEDGLYCTINIRSGNIKNI